MMSETKPIIPKKTSEIITAFVLNPLARLSTSAKPPAMIIIRITIRLKEDDQNDNLLLSF